MLRTLVDRKGVFSYAACGSFILAFSTTYYTTYLMLKQITST